MSPRTTTGITVAGGNGYGLGDNQLDWLYAVFVDNNGNIYIADTGISRIQKWDPGAKAGITVTGGNGVGSESYQLTVPTDVLVDTNGNIYIAYRGNNRIQKWAP